ncbi:MULTISPECIES: hypothetical protein [Streptomyces]|uniref:MerR family transcriptional regulator n=1 Tax=Streptomyces canarius TaxID=285453 RepID=A0ABQ3D7D2_9ACTN|nr:hypothetical protein [Streptomyces canarius]GHA62650.1 hypothetical protein GCM10010345_78480 [Streptomyces canarius]
MEAHRAEVATRMTELRENLVLLDHEIDVCRGRLAAGDADRLWVPLPKPQAG